jgi:hypothetical protein
MIKSSLQIGHIKQLEWAISLCRTDLNQCSDGDRLNIKESLYSFIYWADEEFKTTAWLDTSAGEGKNDYKEDRYKRRPTEGYFFPPIPLKIFLESSVTPEILAAVQNSFRKKLELIVSGLPAQLWRATGLAFSVVVSKHSGRFVRNFWPSSTPFNEHLVLVAEYSLIEHLIESGIMADQIRSCPECQSLFLSRRKVREDRKRYCPYARCASNSASRAWREREGEKLKQKERIRSANRYEHKVHKKYPKTKIKKARKKK